MRMDFRLARKRQRRGFSLIELLIVCAIIALLMAVLCPSLAAARSQARAAHCASNLRQWAMTMRMYAQENSDYVVGRGQGQMPMDGSATANVYNALFWYNTLPVMMKQRTFGQMYDANVIPRPGRGFAGWICSESVEEYPSNRIFFSYGQNMDLSPTSNLRPTKLGDLGNEQTFVYMGDSAQRFGSIWPTILTQPKEYNPVMRHLGKTNLAFADGHVSLVARSAEGILINPMTSQNEAAEIRWKTPNNTWSGPTLP